MMENRSFDHMLGYLSLEDANPAVAGLREGMGNEGPDGRFHPVAPMGARLVHEKVLEPGHSARDVAEQLAGRNRGFVRNYAAVLARNHARLVERSGREGRPQPAVNLDPTLVLGYQTAVDVPVYDHLARHHQVLDHWFSSMPGPTWENRLYATAGGMGPQVPPEVLGHTPEWARRAPVYDRPAFTRWLPRDAWRWYSHDPATLRLVDSAYQSAGERDRYSDANFAYFNRRSLLERRTFLDDAERGDLPPVSWIDPNFVDFRLYGPPGSNDDHPPARVMLGQELILTVLLALTASPQRERTLLLITYDEHGGFYDHVVPGDFPVAGDEGSSYGVRVPALVVSPHADPGVCHSAFDHTSILKTILLRFAEDPGEALWAIGSRTERANHFGELLTRAEPRPPDPRSDLDALIERVADWKRRAYQGQLLEEPHPGERLFEAVTDLQGEIVAAGLFLREAGVTPGKP
jgi:phospholipase C